MIDVDEWPDDWDREADVPHEVTCNRCGKGGLEWVDIGGTPPRYKLYEGKRIHQCSEKDLHAQVDEDFDVLP